ncbi:phosphoglycolate phosphatase [Dethiosulfatibacter aminovorans DSM 17477]|uniref:Phosphoglycolate phosphatase n=1 Tax=Dethiosulfatibacter aminovorans DSM 17477 TaxID=1121476 RepID=A0A1M6BT46_9FIRM|nr:HAD hydrolase-like protein [Dethiosulfatibacter aminovorans]SHI51949.1 phosphoglycolate phosphatase [Dethiosulfatibacter aminovorans DSM 17477]
MAESSKKCIIEDVKTIILDFDGTIHESIKVYGPAFRKCYRFLVDLGCAEEKEWADGEIARWLGFTKEEMWKDFMPDLDTDIRHKAGGMIGKEMNSLLSGGKGVLYHGALEVLEGLKKRGYSLVFMSNCSVKYRDMVTEVFNLDRYFDHIYSSEEFGFIPKDEIFRMVSGSLKPGFAMVGDRHKDMEVGVGNDVCTIGCLYGYGNSEELKDADRLINDISELLEIFK